MGDGGAGLYQSFNYCAFGFLPNELVEVGSDYLQNFWFGGF